jgi:hypothetical protein
MPGLISQVLFSLRFPQFPKLFVRAGFLGGCRAILDFRWIFQVVLHTFFHGSIPVGFDPAGGFQVALIL